jgi:hypothetical protein
LHDWCVQVAAGSTTGQAQGAGRCQQRCGLLVLRLRALQVRLRLLLGARLQQQQQQLGAAQSLQRQWQQRRMQWAAAMATAMATCNGQSQDLLLPRPASFSNAVGVTSRPSAS